MSSPITSSSESTANISATTNEANTATSGAVASVSNQQQLSSASTISSLSDLKSKSPELYKKMMEGIAFGMVNKMQRDQLHLKEAMQKARQND
jgi:hypothetical protein